MDQTEHAYLLGLIRIPQLGAVRIKKLKTYFTSYQEVFLANAQELCRAGLPPSVAETVVSVRPTISLQKEQELLSEHHIHTLSFEEKMYPPLLKEIYDPPPLLFVKGDPSCLQQPCISIVGTRRPTYYGKCVVTKIVEPLAKQAITIVSGLAYGIDTLVHQTTCQAQGKTVAILGSSIDEKNFYPQKNLSLAKTIIETGGAILSEFPPETPPKKHFFPFRNRLIAGISFATLVIEAAKKSGSLITAKAALESNREVFAVPGPITSAFSVGPNNLIKMGARVLTEAEDILSLMELPSSSIQQKAKIYIPQNPIEDLLWNILTNEPLHIDELLSLTQKDLPSITNQLTLMEMNGLIRHLGGMYYIKNSA